jgi:hypothetical protein
MEAINVFRDRPLHKTACFAHSFCNACRWHGLLVKYTALLRNMFCYGPEAAKGKGENKWKPNKLKFYIFYRFRVGCGPLQSII